MLLEVFGWVFFVFVSEQGGGLVAVSFVLLLVFIFNQSGRSRRQLHFR